MHTSNATTTFIVAGTLAAILLLAGACSGQGWAEAPTPPSPPSGSRTGTGTGWGNALASNNPWGPAPSPPLPLTPSPTEASEEEVEQQQQQDIGVVEELNGGGLDCSFGNPIDLGEVSVKQIVNQGEGTISVEVTYDGIGWVAFGSSDGGSMIGGEVIIAKPDEPVSPTNPGKYSIGAKNAAGINLMPKQSLIDASFEQVDGQTILSFTKLLNEDGERPIITDGPNTFIWAVGSSNAFGYHKSRGALPLPSLSFCREPGSDNNNNDNGEDALADFVPPPPPKSYKELWITHGVLMIVSWCLLLPVGIGAALLRSYIPGNGTWFKIHMYSNGTAFLLMTVGFAIAVYIIDQSPSPDHFSVDSKHRVIGLAVYVLAFVQVVMGILRPHLPHNADDKKDSSDTEQEEKDLEASDSSDPNTNTNDAAASSSSNNTKNKKSCARIAFEIAHRTLGFGLLGLAWYNCDLGSRLVTQRFGEEYAALTALVWGLVGGISAVVFALYAFRRVRGAMQKCDNNR